MTGDTQLQDSFGDIAVTGISAADVVATNNSGDISLTFSKVPQRVNVTDSFGSITLVLPPARPPTGSRRGTPSAVRPCPCPGHPRPGT